jgi:hypothetical protein
MIDWSINNIARPWRAVNQKITTGFRSAGENR